MRGNSHSGFTLIELSIVLVIIGLIVGGVLVGRDLIEAAAIRAQISQLEKFGTSVNTFRTKYNYIPGDLPGSQASALGFVSRTGSIGDGDGDGQIGWPEIATEPGSPELGGECITFWTDLSSAQLISGSFIQPSTLTPQLPPPDYSIYFPKAKLGGSQSFILAYTPALDVYITQPELYFRIEFTMASLDFRMENVDALTTMEANSIDTKMDDGMPFSGSVMAGNPGEYGFEAETAGVPAYTHGDTSAYCVTSTATYNVTFPGTPNCSLMVKAQ